MLQFAIPVPARFSRACARRLIAFALLMVCHALCLAEQEKAMKEREEVLSKCALPLPCHAPLIRDLGRWRVLCDSSFTRHLHVFCVTIVMHRQSAALALVFCCLTAQSTSRWASPASCSRWPSTRATRRRTCSKRAPWFVPVDCASVGLGCSLGEIAVFSCCAGLHPSYATVIFVALLRARPQCSYSCLAGSFDGQKRAQGLAGKQPQTAQQLAGGQSGLLIRKRGRVSAMWPCFGQFSSHPGPHLS